MLDEDLQSGKCKLKANLSLKVLFGSKYKSFKPVLINTNDLLNSIFETQLL